MKLDGLLKKMNAGIAKTIFGEKAVDVNEETKEIEIETEETETEETVEEKPVEETKEEITDGETVEDQPDAAETEETTETEETVAETTETETVEETPADGEPAAVEQMDARAEFRNFVSAFGSQRAAEYFGKGLNLTAATEQYCKDLKAENEELNRKLAIASVLGDDKPVKNEPAANASENALDELTVKRFGKETAAMIAKFEKQIKK